MTRLDPEVASAEDAGRQRRQYEQVMRPSTSSSPSLAGGTVPPAPRQHQHQPHSSSLPSSLVLLSTSTTDPSLFSFDTVKKLNQAHLATIPPKPYSAISVAQQKQQQQQSGQAKAGISDSKASKSNPLSQLRRASAPDITFPLERTTAPSSGLHLSETSTLQRSPSSKSLSAPRRSLDDSNFRRTSEHSPKQPSQNNKMTAKLGYGDPDFFGSFSSLRYDGSTSNGESHASLSQQARRPNVIPQTRELYLHPSQIFTPDTIAKNTASSYFSLSQSGNAVDNCNGYYNNGLSFETSIALPPMLTLEEIMQPNVFTNQEALNMSSPNALAYGTAYNADQAVTAVQNSANSFSGMPPSTSSFTSYPDFTHESQQTWHGAGGQHDVTGNTYSSYLPSDAPGNSGSNANNLQFSTSPSLQYAQDMTAFSERAAVPHNPQTAPGSLSPGSMSPGDKQRDFSPSRPSTRDGPTSQRSDTPHEAAPQKRSGKLPASVTTTLKNWLLAHTQHPYPTEEEKRALCSDTGLTMNQVSNWFINARRRILPNLGTVAMSSNRKQLTQYNPPGPRRVFPQGRPQGYPPFHAENEGMYPTHGHPMSAGRLRVHPYANFGPMSSSSVMHNPMAAYNYGSEMGPY